MGAAIEVFEGAQALEVPRTRFAPVKTTDDLLALRSDAYRLTDDARVELVRDQVPIVTLDSDHYKLLDDFDARFPEGAPSLAEAERFEVEGDVRFGADVVVRGSVDRQRHGRDRGRDRARGLIGAAREHEHRQQHDGGDQPDPEPLHRATVPVRHPGARWPSVQLGAELRAQRGQLLTQFGDLALELVEPLVAARWRRHDDRCRRRRRDRNAARGRILLVEVVREPMAEPVLLLAGPARELRHQLALDQAREHVLQLVEVRRSPASAPCAA